MGAATADRTETDRELSRELCVSKATGGAAFAPFPVYGCRALIKRHIRASTAHLPLKGVRL